MPEISWNSRNIVAVMITFALWTGCSWEKHLLEFRPSSSFPRGAAAFLAQQATSPQLFNSYEWGGYLSWYLPEVRTFIDGRGLVEELSLLQDRLMAGDSWRKTFDSYGINTVIIPGMSETSGKVYPLAEQLASAADWRLVFADDIAVVFVRNIPRNDRIIDNFSMGGNGLQHHLVKLTERLISDNPGREEYWQVKANSLQLLGDRQGAVTAYRKVLQINPANEWAKRMLAMGGN